MRAYGTGCCNLTAHPTYRWCSGARRSLPVIACKADRVGMGGSRMTVFFSSDQYDRCLEMNEAVFYFVQYCITSGVNHNKLQNTTSFFLSKNKSAERKQSAGFICTACAAARVHSLMYASVAILAVRWSLRCCSVALVLTHTVFSQGCGCWWGRFKSRASRVRSPYYMIRMYVRYHASLVEIQWS